MTSAVPKEDLAKYDLVLCFDRNGVEIRNFLSRESAHIRQKAVSPIAVRRRPFKQEERLDSAYGTNAWLVGDKAEALLDVYSDLPETSKALLDAPELFTLKSEEDVVWRDGPILIGVVERAREVFARAIDAVGSPKTLILLSKELAMLGRTGSYTDDPTPPLWLVYALRRCKWPGQVWLKVENAPNERTDTKDNLSLKPDGCLQLAPVLPSKIGAWDYGATSEDVATKMHVSLKTPAQEKYVIMAPPGSALPVMQKVQFVDEHGPDLPLVIRCGAILSENRHAIEVERGDTNGDCVAYIPYEFAPRRHAIPYIVDARVDEWGNVSIGISTSEGESLPIEAKDHALQDGLIPQDDALSQVVLRRLLFPNSTSFPVPIWDAQSINGAPPPKRIEQGKRPTLLDREELIKRSKPDLSNLVDIDRARAVLLQEAEKTDTAALMVVRPTFFERVHEFFYNLFKPMRPGPKPASYQQNRVETLVNRKRLVPFHDTPDAEHLDWELLETPEEILKDFCPPDIQIAITDMPVISKSSQEQLD